LNTCESGHRRGTLRHAIERAPQPALVRHASGARFDAIVRRAGQISAPNASNSATPEFD
jgi:hypothetical protein